LAALATANGLGSVEVIPHGLSKEWFQHTDHPRESFVHLGTIAFHKGTDRVVRAWREACPEQAPGLLLHGPILDPEAASDHPVGPVLNPTEIRQTLQTARALVLGSRWPENAPLIILEARAAGCPVIAPNVGGISEIIEHGRDGLLYENDEELIAALRLASEATPTQPHPPPRFEDQVNQIESIYRRLVRETA